MHRHPHHDVGGWDHEHCEWVLKNLQQRKIVSILQYQGQNLSLIGTGMYRVFQLDMLHFKRLLGHQKSTFKS